ncbi:S66 family peptidase [Gracilibacillus alcaliphilus]|uniref:S66 family peptidase n=1 Tax=Gracilibacillus alcaliphilus TaxID=1401441 RepID=UPI00195E8791|nr:S66 peptidase family protein [Gracilibacillus alcaliphilus]MBM7675655.1 muramoyltetrapeptide carboxypeptidase LdcA involved in peptidoglycan recycling [Gracilibacillus alcaliphilus]
MKRPAKLTQGDEIRVIAPSRSIKILSDEGIQLAKQRLENIGFNVSFGKNTGISDLQQSSSIKQRIEDLHEAFSDQQVKAVLTVIGGFNCNELLPYINYQLLTENPKILCGYSDITALANAISAKCQLITYSGPHFSSFQMTGLQDYQTNYFIKCLMNEESYQVCPSTHWSDDLWFLDQENRVYEETEWKVYSAGETTGSLYGGNLCTLNLLQGTPYFPNITESILFIEDDELTNPETFARDLASLLQAANGIKGLLIGRFQKVSRMTEEQLYFILDKHPQLKKIPVLYDMDFGHTQPSVTLPIGGTIHVNSNMRKVEIVHF